MTQVLSGIVPGIIDAHIHQWDPFTTPREASRLAPLYRRAPRVFERLTPVLVRQPERELILTAEHVARPYLPVDYAADAAGAVEAVGVPVEAAVHVECGWHRPDQSEETAWLDALPFGTAGNPGLAAIVGNADPRDPDFASVLDAHARASDRFRGIRFMTTWHPDRGVKNWIDEEGVMTSAAFLRGFAALAERGLTYDAYVYSHQLPEVVVLAKEYPDTTIVLDHYAPPVGYCGPMGRSTGRTDADRADLLARWKEDIAQLAGSCPNVVAKHSGLAFPTLGHQQPGIGREQLAERVAPLVEHTTEVFGEDRLVFGSNYPMDKAIATYGTVVGALADLLAPYGPDLLRKVFRDNARAVYRL
ncbi:amidohydrolase family protein [Nocardioides sp. HM23]|uniref:amidohydrolase family protein n=1 Tax=Nocardioides bizhenqiangii TaxID=3095076 RepID=UPI002ACA8D73|nr:amidohydrolase family protein [Nocardioides sp. HM23]MDZ5622019.1 amidohydrolase family protein [Nocardioides sp. HM23]